ncbi:Fatty acid elongase [Phaffia rhodozyma]|uniref:Elongation of fatty acids protein n=1 Tax=Phaffia rhodozyma TaxID=264483 RepID=A0A0F7SIB8_PHARH|nr:Fatty acid elongase [Phaffia rhodozyma]
MLYELLANNVPESLHLPQSWQTYTPGSTPLSTVKSVTLAMITYFIVIFSGRELMRKMPPFKMQFLFQAHNLLLSLGSGLLLALMLEELLPMIGGSGFHYSICHPGAFTPRLETYYIINYFFKYYELIDTVFLVLKKKPLAFLHVFHHSATAVLCFTQLEGTTSVQWVVITINLLVHTIMYYYYFATAGGKKLWWKKYLTTFQITQFVIDLCIIYYASTLLFLARWGRFATAYAPWLPSGGDCAGSPGAAAFGCALISSYLFLFIAFFKSTYKKPQGKDVRGGKDSKVVREGKDGSAVITEKK